MTAQVPIPRGADPDADPDPGACHPHPPTSIAQTGPVTPGAIIPTGSLTPPSPLPGRAAHREPDTVVASAAPDAVASRV